MLTTFSYTRDTNTDATYKKSWTMHFINDNLDAKLNFDINLVQLLPNEENKMFNIYDYNETTKITLLKRPLRFIQQAKEGLMDIEYRSPRFSVNIKSDRIIINFVLTLRKTNDLVDEIIEFLELIDNEMVEMASTRAINEMKNYIGNSYEKKDLLCNADFQQLKQFIFSDFVNEEYNEMFTKYLEKYGSF